MRSSTAAGTQAATTSAGAVEDRGQVRRGDGRREPGHGGGEPLHFATAWEAIADRIPAAPALSHGARTTTWAHFEERDAAPAGRYDTSSLLTLCSAGTAWSARVKERLLEHVPQAALLDFCGSTEGVTYGFRRVRRGDPVFTANFEAAPGLRVIGPDRRELPRGEIGLLAGPTPAAGYHKDPQRSAITFFAVGGQHLAAPGDLGRIEADGSVTLIGRGVSVINTGGEKVYPAEVEEVIGELAGVEDCLVMAVPDERFGQLVAAMVVRSPDHHPGAADITAAVRRSLAGDKVPRLVVFVGNVPRAPNGKIDYPAAQALLAGQLSTSSPLNLRWCANSTELTER